MQRTKQNLKEYRPIVVVLKDGEFAGLKLEDLASDTTYTVFGMYIANQEIYSNDSRKFPVLQALGIYAHNYIEREMRREQENILGILTGTVNTLQQFTEAATTLNTPHGGQTYLRQMPSITGPRSGNSTPAPAAAPSLPPGVSAYTGAWFRIQYPSTFTVRPSLHSETTDRGYDSAFFTAPDDSVEFYVFSPQWTGEPTDIALRPATEWAWPG
jgi:hypothetical protein